MWTMPGRRRKNGEISRVPLSPVAVAVLTEAVARSGDSAHVFPSPGRDVPITAHAATRAICRARPTLGLEYFRVHDLRRTVATGMASLGVNPHTISLVHISVTKGTVTGAYCAMLGSTPARREGHPLPTRPRGVPKGACAPAAGARGRCRCTRRVAGPRDRPHPRRRGALVRLTPSLRQLHCPVALPLRLASAPNGPRLRA